MNNINTSHLVEYLQLKDEAEARLRYGYHRWGNDSTDPVVAGQEQIAKLTMVEIYFGENEIQKISELMDWLKEQGWDSSKPFGMNKNRWTNDFVTGGSRIAIQGNRIDYKYHRIRVYFTEEYKNVAMMCKLMFL